MARDIGDAEAGGALLESVESMAGPIRIQDVDSRDSTVGRYATCSGGRYHTRRSASAAQILSWMVDTGLAHMVGAL
jgi:hypothetical protein